MSIPPGSPGQESLSHAFAKRFSPLFEKGIKRTRITNMDRFFSRPLDDIGIPPIHIPFFGRKKLPSFGLWINHEHKGFEAGKKSISP
jgi:hypothetical protein